MDFESGPTGRSAAPFEQLVDRATQPFRAAGRAAYHFARGKLRGDPVFRAIFDRQLLRGREHLVDIGCGQGVLLALAAAAEHGGGGVPGALALTGVDLRAEAVRRARVALGARARIEVGDMRAFAVPRCDLVAILDVLHYVDHAAQQALLARARAALAPGGLLLLRAGDAAQRWRFRLTLSGDWLVTAARGSWPPRFHVRSAVQWAELLRGLGFVVTLEPMSAGTPFANVLLVAQRA